MKARKRLKEKSASNISFRPSVGVAAMLAKLDRLPHVNRSWAINRSLDRALPGILKEIGA